MVSDELLMLFTITPESWWIQWLAAVEESFADVLFFSAQVYDRLLITSWGHDPGVVPTSNVLTMLNDALTHSAVLIQVNTLTLVNTASFNVMYLLFLCFQSHCVNI